MNNKSSMRCPHRYRADGSDAARLVGMLGLEKFAELQKVFGGRRVWVPKTGEQVFCGTCRWRDTCIYWWHSQGASVASIARHLGISPKSVYRVLNQSAK